MFETSQKVTMCLKRIVFGFAQQDDMQIRVFNYNTLERVHNFEAHSDYIRAICVHPTQPYILTSSGKLVTALRED